MFAYGRSHTDGSEGPPPMSTINFDDLFRRTFLLPMDENGERKRATISDHVNTISQDQVSREDQLRFKLKIDGDQLDDLVSNNQLMEYLEDNTDTGQIDNGLYKFKCIRDHRVRSLLGPMTLMRDLPLILILMNLGITPQRAIQTLSILDDSSLPLIPYSTIRANQHVIRSNQHVVNNDTPDFEKFRPYFGWVNVDTVQKTMEQSTQWGVFIARTFPMRKHLKSRNPALNIPRRYEPIATDTVFLETPAEDSCVIQAQVFVGRDTLVADAYPMKSGKQLVSTPGDNIRRRGAIDKLLCDSAKTEISNKVMDILRPYHISNWHSEPYHQNQNRAEWQYRTI